MTRSSTTTSAPLAGAPTPWANRIVGSGETAPGDLLANPYNWRIHAGYQKQAMDRVLRSIGMIQGVIVNTTTGHVIDGHMRIMLALEVDQPTIPITYVTLTADEEREAILYYHQVGSYAGIDRGVLRQALTEAGDLSGDPIIARMVSDLDGIAKKDLALPPDGMENAPEALFGSEMRPRARQDTYQAPEGDNRLLSGRGTVELSERDDSPERHALSIVLTQADYRRWQDIKRSMAIKGDAQALIQIMDALESQEDDDDGGE